MESDKHKTSAQSPGNCEAHMVLSWYGGNEWHMNKTSSPFHCACLICPLSFLHQPIFTDTTSSILPPPPQTPHPELTATYITLTNQRLQGFSFASHLVIPVRCPLKQQDHLPSWKKWQQSNSNTDILTSSLYHLLFIEILFCFSLESMLYFYVLAFFLIVPQLYFTPCTPTPYSFSPPPTYTFFIPHYSVSLHSS